MQDRPESQRPSPRRALAGLGVVVALVAVAALSGEPSDRGTIAGPAADTGLVAFILSFDTMMGAAAVVGVVVLGVMIWVVATAVERVPRERRPWWHTPLVMLVLTIGVVGLVVLLGEGAFGDRLAQLVDQVGAFAGNVGEVPTGDPTAAPEAPVDMAVRRGAVLVGMLLAIVLLSAAVLVHHRIIRDALDQDEEADRTTAPLLRAVEASLDDLDAEADPCRAIQRCYAHLEAALRAAGHARRPSETPRAHRSRCAEALGPAAAPVATLIDRFERARYDDAPVGEGDRAAAVTALHDARARLAADRAKAVTGSSQDPGT